MATLTSPALTDLLEEVRDMLGQADENNSNWTNKELIRYLNDGTRRYMTEAIQYSEGLFTAQTDLNISSGSDTVALPADFFEVVRLYKKRGSDYIILPYRNRFDESYSSNGTGNSGSYLPYYYFRGNNLVLRPTPNFTEASGLRLEYIHFPTTINHPADSLSAQVSPIFKDLITAYAVYRAKLTESIRGNGIDTYSSIKAHVSDLFRQFKDTIQERSHSMQVIKPFDSEDV